jgi:hypothetical protein
VLIASGVRYDLAGRADLIGRGKRCLVQAWQPAGTGKNHEVRRAPGTRPFRTQHTGLPDVQRTRKQGKTGR